MVEQQIDSILTVIENPIRRQIIKRLSQEPSYPLELAKEIGQAQQLVTSHLAILEKMGLVSSSIEASPNGPKRKMFYLNKSSSLSFSFGPHLFNEQCLNFETLPSELSSQAADFMKRISDIQGSSKSKIEPFSCLLKDIDAKLDDLESEKAVLLFIRNLAMKNVAKDLACQDKTHDERRILHHILDERTKDIESISKSLNLKESFVRVMLEKLREEIP